MEKINKKKILVLGSYGMIGHQIYYELEKQDNYELFNISKTNKINDLTLITDLTKFSLTQDLINNIQPDIIINCAGILIEECEKNPSKAILLNAYLPNFLKSLCDSEGIKLIQISTDCVYSGESSPYLENSTKDGTSVYSKTKSLGEINSPDHLTIRTSVIGPDLYENGQELFAWFMSQSGRINGYKKSIWSGISSIELAKTIDIFIRKDIKGIYNVCSEVPITKFDLLKLMAEESNKDIEIIPVEGVVTNKTLIDSRKELGQEFPSYRKMVKDLFYFINRSDSYEHYKTN